MYSSDLGRAIQTAKYISEACKVKIKVDVDLREVNIANINACIQFKKNTGLADRKQNFKNKLDCITLDIETQRQRQDRIINVMNNLAHLHANETIVVVSLASIVKGFLEFVIGVEGESFEGQFSNDNTAFNSFIKEVGT